MEITREAVLQWMVQERRSNTWLADQCGVTKQAVSNWLSEGSPRPISSSAQIIIRRLMEMDAAASEAKPPHTLVIEFEDDDYSAIENAALQSQQTIRDWAKDTLLTIAEVDPDKFAQFISTTLPTVKQSLTVANLPDGGKAFEIPLLRAAAGSPIIADAETIEVERNHGTGRFMLELRGDSMEPKFRDKERIILHDKTTLKRPVLKYGEFYLFVHNESSTFKQWQKNDDGQKVLRSVNPVYKDIIANESTEWIGWYDPADNLKI